MSPRKDHEAKRSILNFFATALGSANDPAVTAALRTLLPFSGAATSAIIGRPERLDAMGASFVNAISANLLDFDDTHLDTIIHPAAPVAAPVLALAQARGFSGRAVLTAFILGVEVECRVGNAVSPGHYARGWHITSTCGVFGAAAACAKLLGLSADQISNAIGIAASQSAGIVENLPSAAKNVSVGNAARNGLFAALLAAEGYSASPRAIEGPLGWARAMGDEPDLGAPDGRSRQDLGDREEYLQALSGGHRVSCRDRRLLQFAGEAEPAHRRYRVRHGAGLGAAAGARRSGGSQRTRCAGQHSSLRRLCAAAGRGRRPRIRGRDRIPAGHRVLAPEGEGGARRFASGWRRARHCPADVGRDVRARS